jgi:hypothetical protein
MAEGVPTSFASPFRLQMIEEIFNKLFILFLSRVKGVTRLMGMRRNETSTLIWMAGVVLVHLGITLVHGSAHAQARVPLSPAATVFVFGVILAGPLIGMGLAWPARRIGAGVIAVTMTGALVFGIVNHFMFSSPDHITHVNPQWRSLFTATAVLLAVTEAMGSILAIRILRLRRLV